MHATLHGILLSAVCEFTSARRYLLPQPVKDEGCPRARDLGTKGLCLLFTTLEPELESDVAAETKPTEHTGAIAFAPFYGDSGGRVVQTDHAVTPHDSPRLPQESPILGLILKIGACRTVNPQVRGSSPLRGARYQALGSGPVRPTSIRILDAVKNSGVSPYSPPNKRCRFAVRKHRRQRSFEAGLHAGVSAVRGK